MKLEPKFRGLIEPLYALTQSHAIWWELSRRPVVLLNGEVFEELPSFFVPTIAAHFVVSLMAVCRLFDKRGDTYSIPRLISELKQRDSRQANRVEAVCEGLSPILKKIQQIRHKVYAHRDDEEVPEVRIQRTRSAWARRSR